MLPDKWASDSAIFMDKTVAGVLVGKNPPEREPNCSTLEAYKETPVFIPMDITEDVVCFVAVKLLVHSGPSGMDSEDLQGWLLKLRINNLKIY